MSSIGATGSATTPAITQTVSAAPPKRNDGDADDAPKAAAPPSNRLLDVRA